jgi:hypothetical protein
MRLLLANDYDLDLQRQLGGTATWKGLDGAEGFLEKREDGTYRGTVLATSGGTLSGTFLGESCTRPHVGSQYLDVIGQPISGGNVLLSFVPKSRPTVSFSGSTCPVEEDVDLLAPPDLEGWWQASWGPPPVDASRLLYMPFANSRWNTPQVGYSVFEPSPDQPVWEYMDDEDDDAAEDAGYGTSVWYVRTEYVDGHGS